ncbi:unnamed protein product [Rotaria sp. Silwood1]|nr:unnamed protein product [Rotaria sp. Silwood1]CAF3353514.1 unnamed protein product [Rotaria sp. Silwood1]CAF3358654.1 unnamed protein product [Rotaria sp. Silwood1]CAF4729249.1 unnamed protein product [Rotaria sp. Silwood1]
MSSTRTAPRTTNVNKTTSTLNTHHTNGSTNSYDNNDSTVNVNNMSEIDSNVQRSVLTKNTSQSEGIYRNPRFVHAVTIGLLGQPVIIQTTERERFHGVLETISSNGDVVLSVAHRLDNNNNDVMGLSTSFIDLFDTVDSSSQSFELNRRIIPSSNIVEIIAGDIDLSGSGKCMLDENPKVTQLEDERFNRMEHFYGTDEIDPDTFEDLDIGDDGKAGYDPEDMFHTNREKFNTTTDFHESKYTNVPIRQMTTDELAEIEKKASEIEKGTRNDDIDEDDAGVKRPSEYNQTHTVDDGNSNIKNNQSSRSHTSDRRSDFRYDAEYNASKRGSWREQRTGGGAGNNRRGGGPNNYSMNNPKSNQRSEQTQYTSSRSSEQSTNNRQQQYKSRNNRFTDNRSPHEGRDSPLQTTNDETTRGQRINSGSFSQGQNSGPTSPSTTVPARTIYSTNNRPPIGRNSPAPYTGSSSSRNNSTTTTSPSPTTAATTTSYQTNSTGTGNYSQQSNNKMAKKQLRNEQQSTTDESDQPKQQRNQQQTSSNNQLNTVPLNRPSQLHTQQIRQQQQQQQQQPISSSNNNVPPPLTLPTQDDHSSSHETINPNQSDQTMHITNAPVYTQHTTGTITPSNVKTNSGLNPEADEFVPVFSRESSSRPESRGATSSMSINTFIPHAHPQALHLLQQQQVQQTQVQQSSMIPPTHPQSAAALYQQYYQPSFTNMAPFVTSTPQQMNVSMMGTQMMPPQTQQQLSGNGPNTSNAGTGGMTTPSGSSGSTYKTSTNPGHSGDTGTTGVNNVAPKKAVVSVQRAEQSNVPQQQQVTGAPPMVYPTASIRYYQPDYMTQQATPPSMQLQQIPFYYPINTSGIIQAAAAAASGVGPPQNIMIPSTSSSAGPATPAPPSIYYPGVYPDPRMYGVYPSAASVNPGGVNPNWQLNRSPPHQQQQPTDQQRAYVGGQNVVSQVPPPTGTQNTGSGGGSGRSASTSGPSGQAGASSAGSSMTPQYALNGSVAATYAYGSPAAWYSAQAQVPSPQTNIPPQVNAYSMMFDPSQQAPPQQPTYVHPSPYEAAYFQQPQQQLTQQGLDTVPPGSYNR